MIVEQLGILAGWKDVCGAIRNISWWMGRMVVEKLGILAGGWKDGCGASGNIGWWIEGMTVEQGGILTGG